MELREPETDLGTLIVEAGNSSTTAANPRKARTLPWLAVALLTFGLTAITTRQAFDRYDALRTGWSWDLAYYNQWYWALTQGDGTITVRPLASYATEGPRVWKMNYSSPARWLIAPLYRVFPSPRTLLVVQNVVFWLILPASYTLVRSETDSTAVALSAVALVPLTPLLWPLVWNDFRELQLALPFIIWAVQGVRSRTFRTTAIGVGGMLACRQEFAPVVILLAIIPPRQPEDREQRFRWVQGLIGIGMIWFLYGFLVYLRVVVGRDAPALYLDQFGGRKAYLGETFATSSEFLFLGLGAWGALMFANPRTALICLYWVYERSGGGWALRFLEEESWHHVRYVAPMVGTGLAAGLVGYSCLANWWRARKFGLVGLGICWLVAAGGSGLMLKGVFDRCDRQPVLIAPDEVKAIWSWIDRVKPDDGVLADYSVTAPLSSRQFLYSYRLPPNQPEGYPNLSKRIRWVFSRNSDIAPKLFMDQGFKMVHRGAFLTILEREGSLQPALSK